MPRSPLPRYCKRELDEHFSFPDKIGGCLSDYLPSVVYISSIAEESSRSREKGLILEGRMNVHSEVDSAEQVPSLIPFAQRDKAATNSN